MNLTHQKAQRLLDELRRILDIANGTLRPCNTDQIEELRKIPLLVEQLQQYLPDRKRSPVPFWKCVIKLNKEKPSLRLTKTLQALYDRAAKIQPGPLTRLMNNSVTPGLSQSERDLVQKLENHLRETPNERPANLESYLPIFDRTASRFGMILRKRVSLLGSRRDEELLSSLGFLELYWQHRSWRDRYEDSIVALYDVAMLLEHEPFIDQIKPLLYGEYFSVADWTKWRRRSLARKRQQNFRVKVKARKIARRKRLPSKRRNRKA